MTSIWGNNSSLWRSWYIICVLCIYRNVCVCCSFWKSEVFRLPVCFHPVRVPSFNSLRQVSKVFSGRHLIPEAVSKKFHLGNKRGLGYREYQAAFCLLFWQKIWYPCGMVSPPQTACELVWFQHSEGGWNKWKMQTKHADVSTGWKPQVFKHHLLEVYNDAQHPPLFCNHNVNSEFVLFVCWDHTEKPPMHTHYINQIIWNFLYGQWFHIWMAIVRKSPTTKGGRVIWDGWLFVHPKIWGHL